MNIDNIISRTVAKLTQCIIVLVVILFCGQAKAQVCGGVPLLGPAAIPIFLLPASVETTPSYFELAGVCYPTVGNTIGGIYLNDGVFQALCGVTDEPAIWTLAGGVLNEFPMNGTFVLAAGADIKCGGCGAILSNCFAITESSIGVVAAGALTQFPLAAPPTSSAIIASCAPGVCFVSLNVMTADNILHSVIGGVDTQYVLPTAPLIAPLSFSDGPIAGVVIVRAGDVVDVIAGGVVTTTALPGAYTGWFPIATGITVTSTGGPTDFVLGNGPVILPFGAVPGPITFNTAACFPNIVGGNMGWPFGAIDCAIPAEVAAGPLAGGPVLFGMLAALRAPAGAVTNTKTDGFQKAAGDTIDVMGPTGFGTAYLGDFEAGWNGWTSVDLTVGDIQGETGDFANIWDGLQSADNYRTNYSSQIGFVDDGVIVPGTGGTVCLDWCYGPSGYIVNSTGGLAGPSQQLANEVRSPVMSWPNATYDGAQLAFDVYINESLAADSSGMLYYWRIRARETAGTWGPWLNRGLAFYGGPNYQRHEEDVSGLIGDGADEVQIALGVVESGFNWGAVGNNGSPGPYFDNVNFKVYPRTGPSIEVRDMDLAQDAFPSDGALNFAFLPNNHVRFDMARSTSLPNTTVNTPGDNIEARITPLRDGSVLNGVPRLHYSLDPNPLYDPHRTLPLVGVADGIQVGVLGDPAGLWTFDLSDDQLMYPGDVIHYYLRAEEDLGGNIEHATAPANLAGFAQFDSNVYDSRFVMRALPTMFSTTPGDQPAVLFWDDSGDQTDEDEWFTSFNNLGLLRGVDYDVYTTHGADSAIGSGLGGRANVDLIQYYDTIIYTSGSMLRFSLNAGPGAEDPADDIALLTDWLELGDKNLLIVGDNLLSDLIAFGQAEGQNFATTWLGADLLDNDAISYIHNQSKPGILPIAGNAVGLTQEFHVVDFGYGRRLIDAVQPTGNATRIAEFASLAGAPGAYSIAAGIHNSDLNGSDVVYFPVSFDAWFGDDSSASAVAARTTTLAEILLFFGVTGDPGSVSAVETVGPVFSAVNSPNPLNPTTTIHWSIPEPGHLSIGVYNLKGELVDLLVDQVVSKTSGEVTWSGKDDQGRGVASGVYFYRVNAGQHSIVRKMSLVK